MPASDHSLTAQGRPRLLVVDDEPRVLVSLARMLKGQYNVVTESDPEAALARVRSGEHFDLFVLDIMMPQLGGWELLALMVDHASDLESRVVLMTGALDPGSQPQAFAATPVLSKPFRRDALVEVLAGLLTASANQRQ